MNKLTKEDFKTIPETVIAKHFNFQNKLKITEYITGEFTMEVIGSSEECDEDLNFIDEAIPTNVDSLQEAVDWCNYYINKYRNEHEKTDS